MSEKLHISSHPLVQHKISLLRDKRTRPKQVRELLREISSLLGYEATRDLALVPSSRMIEGPIAPFQGYHVKEKIGIVPILRAGLGFVDAMLDLVPAAKVLHLGLYREKTTCQPVEYYNKLPTECHVEQCIIVDPMIATAGTAIAAINILKDWGVKRIKFICACASRDGVQKLMDKHPDVELYVGVVDETLSDSFYIVPGFGDAGDRLFKTAK